MHRNPYKSKIYYRNKLAKLSECTKSWVSGAYYDTSKGRYIKYGRGSWSKWLKKCSNRKIRRFRGDLPNNVHKLFDFWWSLW